MTDRFEPSTAFEGFLKGNIEEIFRAVDGIKNSIDNTNNDIVILKAEWVKEITEVKVKISKIKGWILGVSVGFGFLGGIFGLILAEVFHLKDLLIK